MKDGAGQAVDCYIRQLFLAPIKEVLNGYHVDVFINYSTVSTLIITLYQLYNIDIHCIHSGAIFVF